MIHTSTSHENMNSFMKNKKAKSTLFNHTFNMIFNTRNEGMKANII